jgi:hypothetical protein
MEYRATTRIAILVSVKHGRWHGACLLAVGGGAWIDTRRTLLGTSNDRDAMLQVQDRGSAWYGAGVVGGDGCCGTQRERTQPRWKEEKQVATKS